MGDMADDARDAEERYDLHNQPGPGEWRNREGQILQIKNMQTSHIENCIRFLGNDKRGWRSKIQEFHMELARRRASGERVEILNHRIEVTEDDILALMKSKGVKIPASGAGVYIQFGDQKCRLASKKVTVEFDTQKQLPKSAAMRTSSRRSSTTGRKGSGARR